MATYAAFPAFDLYSGLRFEKLPGRTGKSKRYGTYIEAVKVRQEPFVVEKRIRHESDGTWEFLTPTPSFDNAPPSVELDTTTPAQKLAMSYRASSRQSSSDDSRPSTPPPRYMSPDCSNNTLVDDAVEIGLEKTPIAASRELKPIPCATRKLGLLHAFDEAMETAKRDNEYTNGDERVVCPRSGCRDTLPNVNALMYHLHIHDIVTDDELVVCPRCKVRYEHSHELRLHKCRRRGLSVSGPIGALCRVFNLKSTDNA